MRSPRPRLGRTGIVLLALTPPAFGAVYALTGAALGPGYRPPALAAFGCLWGGVLLTWALVRAGLPRGLAACLPVLALIPFGQCWLHVPTTDGWSNAQAGATADRVVARLTDPKKLVPKDLGAAWADATRLADHYPPQRGRVRGAQGAWEARLDERLRGLESGQTPPTVFEEGVVMRATIADQVPQYHGRILAAERAWCEHQAGRLIARLDTLPASEPLRPPVTTYALGVIEPRFPEVLERLAAAERAWVERTEDGLAAAVRTAPPTDPDAFLARRAAADAFLGKYKRPGEAVRAAERDWHRRCAEHGLAEAVRLEKTDPAAAADALTATSDRLARSGAADTPPEALRAALAAAVARSLDDGRRRVREAVRADRYAAAAAIADELFRRLHPAARTAGSDAELAAFRESCRFLAELASAAGKPDPP